MEKLSSNSDWESKYLPLANSDIRGYQDPNTLQPYVGRRGTFEDDQLGAVNIARVLEAAAAAREMAGEAPADFDLAREDRTQRDGTGEMRRTLSWIWTMEGVQQVNADQNSDDILRVEWCKSRARANRATEEVLLLKEEMRRTLVFLTWRAKWWRTKPVSWDGVSIQLQEGIVAYAKDQALIQDALATHFEALWEKPLAEVRQETAPAGAVGGADEGDDDDDGDDLFEEDEHIDDEDVEVVEDELQPDATTLTPV